MAIEQFKEIARRISCGNAEAAIFLEVICEIFHFWDDLIDKDVALSDDDINARMWQALVSLPRNGFYRANFELLNPIIVNSIQNWFVANEMENTKKADDLNISFIMRSSYVDLFSQTALICGGLVFARQIGLEVRRITHGETFTGYIANLEKERMGRRN